MNYTDAIAAQAALQADAVAVYRPAGNIRWATLERATQALAQRLWDSGIRPGTVVAQSLHDEVLSLLAMLALARIGASSVSLPPHEVAAAKAQVVKNTQATVLLREPRVAFVPDLCASELVLSPDDALTEAPAQTAPDPRDPNPQAPCFLVVGSGTTGTPKIIPISHRIFQFRTHTMFRQLAMGPADRVATVSTIDYWVTKMAWLSALCHGVPVVLMNRASDLISECRNLQVSILFLSAVHLELLLKQVKQPEERPLNFVRVLNVGGAMLTDALRRRTLKHLCEGLHIPYGTNDLGLATLARPEDIRALAGSVGRPVDGVELQIRDRQGQVLPPGVQGEIWLRSPGMIGAYHMDPETSARDFQAGWYKPGDLGELDPSGQLIHHGRSDHMMIVNGVNISPAEIENCLCLHPAVADASALPIHHPVHQHVPVCAVELRAGAAVTEEALKAFSMSQIGSRTPSRIVILEKMPRNDMGKIRRVELTRQIAQVLGIPVQS